MASIHQLYHVQEPSESSCMKWDNVVWGTPTLLFWLSDLHAMWISLERLSKQSWHCRENILIPISWAVQWGSTLVYTKTLLQLGSCFSFDILNQHQFCFHKSWHRNCAVLANVSYLSICFYGHSFKPEPSVLMCMRIHTRGGTSLLKS